MRRLKKISCFCYKKFYFLLFLVFFLKDANAILWSGKYNFEGIYIQNPGLVKEGKKERSYFLHHLSLKPKIVVLDGVRIYSRLDIFNHFSDSLYLGSFLGSRQGGFIHITHLYASFVHEFGSLIVGRMPLHFGLGMTYHSGDEAFDHWVNHRDVIAYKIVAGRFLISPMLSKQSEGFSLDVNDDINSILFHGQYKNIDSNLTIGLFYEWETGQDKVKHSLQSSNLASSIDSELEFDLNLSNLNVYVSKQELAHSVEIEAGFQWGKVGINSDSKKISHSSFGVALEYEWKPESLPRWSFGVHSGAAEGDDSSSELISEGYTFHRNYNVSFLMFNYFLGVKDFLGTSWLRWDPENERHQTINSLDSEALSNVIYFSPRTQYNFYKKWFLEFVLSTSWLWKNSIQPDGDKSLGYELDASFLYKAHKNLIWKTQFGTLFPGSAFKSCEGCDNKISYGLTTKLMIQF